MRRAGDEAGCRPCLRKTRHTICLVLWVLGPRYWGRSVFSSSVSLGTQWPLCGWLLSLSAELGSDYGEMDPVGPWGWAVAPRPPRPEVVLDAALVSLWMPPYLISNWPVFLQEDVLNTQCGYDVRLKLVRGWDRAGGCWGHWDGEGSSCELH